MPIALGKVAPWRTGVEDPKDPIDDHPVVERRPTHSITTGAVGEQGCDPGPLAIRQLIASHGEIPEIEG
jgi:hypothetical protein